ncbi:DExH-box ATP-dependent RNA helicase DExH15 chloroplastic [Sesamum alatum]|uniref:DExH-box ATP-dependent RNA helicase DExH15 chloroplastic n=1 Tax=Sesamum alatum TaxID=300844 RepID=A0AAE1YGY6_9LAMI|nr:DExH-box ATP-dependent RNA helicase DExH15 chloroplastic [Sesamum alatum]
MTAFSVLSSLSHSPFTVHGTGKLSPLPLLKPFLRFRPLQFFHARNNSYFAAAYKFPNSIFPVESSSQLSDDENEVESDEEDDEDDVAAEEYGAVSGEIGEDSEGEEEEEGEDDGVSEDSGGIGVSGNESRFEELKWQRVERIRNEVREFGEEIIDVEELASIYNFRIDKFQRLAIQAFLRGSSVVVSAPTSSGKTLIAEAAAVATVARGRRLFYTTPLKALSNQKFRDFRETFGDSNVGLLTGDSAVNKDAQILIMTTEILRNMLYQSVGMASSESALSHVDVIVLDEVHYLSDISRGTVWEEIVIYCPKEVQLICLSATVANPDELAGWIGQIHGKTELVTSSKRPVPLNWHFSTRTALLPLLDEKGTGMNRRLSLNQLQLDSSGASQYKDEGSRRRKPRKHQFDMPTLSRNDMNSIRRSQEEICFQQCGFIFSRKGCDAAVKLSEECQLLDECEITEVELALKRFRVQYPDAVRESSAKGLLRGVAAHHAGCLPLWKSFIEELFSKGGCEGCLCTETLAAGINMPARTATKPGRRGIDERVIVVLIQTPYEGAEECCKVLFSGLEPLVSQFTASYGMGAKVTSSSSASDDSNVSHSGRTLEEARKLVEQSFGNYENFLSQSAYKEIADLQEELRAEKRVRTELRRRMELERIFSLKPLLEELGNGHLPFMCLQHTDSDGVQHQIPAVYLGKIDSLNSPKVKNMVHESDSFALNDDIFPSDAKSEHAVEPSFHVALGSDNSWKNMQWQKVSESELGGLWSMEGSLETWSWSLNVPVLSSLSKDDEVLEFSENISKCCGNAIRTKETSYIYEASTTVMNMITFLDEQRSSLLHLQEKHGVKIPCCLDSQFSGMVEAWASGLTWREIMMDCAMDEGDLARLLRRTIDLLAQVPKLPDIDPLLQSNAVKASSVMDRPPISELVG